MIQVRTTPWQAGPLPVSSPRNPRPTNIKNLDPLGTPLFFTDFDWCSFRKVFKNCWFWKRIPVLLASEFLKYANRTEAGTGKLIELNCKNQNLHPHSETPECRHILRPLPFCTLTVVCNCDTNNVGASSQLNSNPNDIRLGSFSCNVSLHCPTNSAYAHESS